MKKLLMLLALIITMASCNSNEETADTKTHERDRVEVIYFHGKQRCPTCMAIESCTKDVVNTLFANELKDGSLVYRTVDISTPEGEKIADRYEVTWSSLFVNKWEDGHETPDNMTEFGFTNARSNPDAFRNGLADKIRQALK